MKKKLLAIALSAQMILSSLITAPMAYASELVTAPEEPTAESVVVEGEETALPLNLEDTSSETTDPVDGETTNPVDGETTNPVDGETTNPVDGETTNPVDGETTNPVDGETTNPVDGETTNPVDGETTNPVDGETTNPADGETTNPVDGETTNPADGETTNPADGETTNPDEDEDSDTPEESEPATLSWMPYDEFVFAEGEKALANPEMYVGYTATFNTVDWDTFCFVPNIESADLASISFYEESNVFVDIDAFPEMNDMKITITDYYLFTDAESTSDYVLWYKFEVAEGTALSDELSAILTNNPYVFYQDLLSPPALLIQPKQAMFASEKVEIKNGTMATAGGLTLDTALLPEFFDVSWFIGNRDYHESDAYDLGDVSSWGNGITSAYRYVDEASIIMIPPEVTVAYEKLLEAEDMDSYMATFMALPEYVIQMLSEKHFANLEKHMDTLGSKTLNATVTINDVVVPVSVYGPLPKDANLSVEVVADQAVLDAGFPIEAEDVEDIVAALDIKIMKNGAEWQPTYGMQVAVSIGMKELGYEDGTIMRMHHKHGETITTLDLFVVMDGTVTLWTDGFSMFVVNNIKDKVTTGTRIPDDGTHTITVGDEVVFYFPPRNNANENPNYTIGTWHVTDTQGAIYYTVHSDSNATIGNTGMSVPWIKINALKEGTVTLQFFYGNNNANQTFELEIESPKAASGQKHLYIQDLVNTTGTIQATLVDDQGQKLSLAGAAFSWKRSDDLFIIPYAYSTDYSAVNIAVDHGGLTEARRSKGGYVTYTVTATLANGQVKTADYTVYYQSEIINANFETPNAAQHTYSFAPNGYEGLYWKTTAPGTGNNRTKDIEIGDVTNQNNNGSGGTDFGVRYAADYDDEKGMQFAELNAEEFGALYQDIITAPGEDLEWEFAHAPRPRSSWAGSTTNAMFIVIGATEDAQELTTQAQLEALGQEAMRGNTTNAAFLNCQAPVTITYAGATYKVWYHNAGIIESGYRYDNSIYDNADHGWTDIAGTYTVPESQYRTRVFFVSDPTGAGNNKNSGNLIDKARAGQYKTFLIEYYEEKINADGNVIVEHLVGQDESDEALMYSTYTIQNLNNLINVKHLFLHNVLVNGQSYPFDLRYKADDTDDTWSYDKAALYIQNYKGTPEDPIPGTGKDYADYDIVLQVYLRDTVVSVKKELVFPATMTTEQKLKLMESLTTADPKNPSKVLGYQANFELYCPDEDDLTTDVLDKIGRFIPTTFTATDEILITAADPSGSYSGNTSMENKDPDEKRILPTAGTYVVEETGTTSLIGLELDSATFTTETFSYANPTKPISKTYDTISLDPENPPALVSPPFTLQTEDSANAVKIAQVTVANIYKEKTTRVYYKAVGNGKVKLDTADAVYEDAPFEELLFYSGVSIGSVGHEGHGSRFAGWYKDEACTIPVTEADGVCDAENHAFKPNANIIGKDANGNYVNLEEVTFYAKFVTQSITIERSNVDPAHLDQVFVYQVHCEPKDGSDPFDMYVSITGNGSCTIYEAPEGTYTVTELTDFTWRYNEPTVSAPQTFVDDQTELVFQFNGAIQKKQWLNGFDLEKNVQGNVAGSSPIVSGDSGGSGTGT